MHDGPTPVMDALVDFVLGLEAASLPPAVVEAASRSITDWLGTAIRGAAEPLAGALAAGDQRQRRAPAGHGGRARPAHERAPRVARQRRAVARPRLRRHAPAVHRPRRGARRARRAGARRVASPVRRPGAGGLRRRLRSGDAPRPRHRPRARRSRLARHRRARTFRRGGGGGEAARTECRASRSRARHRGNAGRRPRAVVRDHVEAAPPGKGGDERAAGGAARARGLHGLHGDARRADRARRHLPRLADLGPAIEDLGKRFEILENSTKFYAACHLTHATIDAGAGDPGARGPAPDAWTPCGAACIRSCSRSPPILGRKRDSRRSSASPTARPRPWCGEKRARRSSARRASAILPWRAS